MSAPFVAEIRMFACNFAPAGWAYCDGQLMALSQNTALFSLVGTFYGGDGKSTFALPDMQGRSPVSQGQSTTGTEYFLGELWGSKDVQLIQSEIPGHTHSVKATTLSGDSGVATGAAWGSAQTFRGQKMYASPVTTSALMHPGALASMGGGLPHNNMQPYLGLNFCIALQGVFPARP